MFQSASDLVDATTVVRFSGLTNSDADYERYLVAISDFDRKFRDRDAPVMVVIVEPGNETPNALWRKRFAVAAAEVKSKALFILVTDSSVVRGVMRAIDWIRPFAIETAAASTFEEAVELAERRRGWPLPSLAELRRRVLASGSNQQPTRS